MDIKKKCINLKKQAEKFGYKIKLTHVQELISKYEGFENRHAMFKSFESNEVKKKEKKDWYYYEIHVFQGIDNGYSVSLRTQKALEISNGILDESEIINQASNLSLFQDDEDYNMVDRIEEIEEDDWKFFTDYHDGKIECFTCKQLHDKEDIKPTEPNRLDSICNNCYNNEVKMYISTDDSNFDWVETFIDNDYLEWSISNDKGFLEMLIEGDYGPSTHTDPLLFDTVSPTSKQISTYITVINTGRRESAIDPVGYSVTVDEDSFKKWLHKNRRKLSDKGFFV